MAGKRLLPLAAATFLAACGGQPLEPWHTARLSEEFDAGMLGDEVSSFADYLALEDRLFAQLEEKVYARVGTGPHRQRPLRRNVPQRNRTAGP